MLMVTDKYRGNLLSCIEVKQDDDDFKNETVIELDYDLDAEEQEQEKSENDTDQYPITEKQNIKKKFSCDICSMSFASKDILDFHTEVSGLCKKLPNPNKSLLDLIYGRIFRTSTNPTKFQFDVLKANRRILTKNPMMKRL